MDKLSEGRKRSLKQEKPPAPAGGASLWEVGYLHLVAPTAESLKKRWCVLQLLKNVSAESLQRIELICWDRFIEKHEGPESWASTLIYVRPEFIEVEGDSVLLPVSRDHNPNIHIIRSIKSDDGLSVVLFLRDTTFIEDTDDDVFSAGYVAICERVQDEEYFVAIFYHEWFIIN